MTDPFDALETEPSVILALVDEFGTQWPIGDLGEKLNARRANREMRWLRMITVQPRLRNLGGEYGMGLVYVDLPIGDEYWKFASVAEKQCDLKNWFLTLGWMVDNPQLVEP